MGNTGPVNCDELLLPAAADGDEFETSGQLHRTDMLL